MLQGSRVIVAPGTLSATGGMGGNGGSPGGTPFVEPGAGFAGAPGGGGRIEITSGFSVANWSQSLGTNAEYAAGPLVSTNAGQKPGTPTIKVVTAMLTQTDPNFVPVNSLNSWEVCTANTNCYTKYTLTISPPEITGDIQFRLNSTAFQGDSTNRCFRPDGSGGFITDFTCTDPINNAPDYFFDPARQPAGVYGAPSNPFFDSQTQLYGQIMSATQARNSADAWVSSRDYGGFGNVIATVTIGGFSIPAGVNGSTIYTQAQLPIDSNNNALADAWETQRNIPLTPPVSPIADAEINQYGAPSGDGFTAYEEYRGFVLIGSHERTHPVDEQDVFVVDEAGIFAANSGIVTPTTTPFKFRRVPLDAANPKDQNGTDPSQGVERLNRNFTNNGEPIYALIVVSSQLPAGVLGRAEPPERGNILANDGFPVELDLQQIQAKATNDGFSLGVLTAQTLAHEIGHKFTLAHYVDQRPVAPALSAGVSAQALAANPQILPNANYAPATDIQNGRGFYVWTQFDPSKSTINPAQFKIQNRPPPPPRGGDLATQTVMDESYVVGPYIANTANGDIALLGWKTDLALPTPPTFIELWVQLFDLNGKQNLMNYTPRTMQQQYGLLDRWQFHVARDLQYMCVLNTCPVHP